MSFVEIIARKRDGVELSAEEIRTFVRGATSGAVADEQLAALLMAICIRGASTAETRALVEAMSDSGRAGGSTRRSRAWSTSTRPAASATACRWSSRRWCWRAACRSR
jgi:anthranilate phosphoribosyltransferase